MIRKIVKVLGLAICLMVIGSLFCNYQEVSAGASEWSPEPIPSRVNNLVGPTGVDIRDLALFNDGEIMYAATGNSIIPDPLITSNVTYKSIDGGSTWTTLKVPITTDLIATMPDNDQVLAIANKSTPAVYLSVDAGIHWKDMGVIQDPDPPDDSVGASAVAIDDIAISSQREGINYLAVAGKESGDVANLWYFELGTALATTWHETNTLLGFDPASEATALAFSPTFGNDATAAVITNDSTNVTLQLLDFGGGKWNGTAGYPSPPSEIVTTTGIINLNSASLALAPDYVGYEPSARLLYIGLAVNGGTEAKETSGIYRFEDTDNTIISTNITIKSVAFDGDELVAGSYDTNTVYVCTNPYDTLPTIEKSDATKSPSGENQVVVAWANHIVVAGTSGDESAFAISEDYGFTFNDISLIDTVISNAEDVAVGDEGEKIYLLTDDGTNDEPYSGPDISLWLYNSVWQRVFSKLGAIDYIVRMANDGDTDSVYLAQRTTKTIYYNDAGGTTHWQDIMCGINVQDLAVESAKVIYVIEDSDMAAASRDGGVYWTKASTNLVQGATILNISPNVVLAGSQDGFVAYTSNGGLSWAKIPQPIEEGAKNVQVVADEDFAANKMIYAASDKLNGSIWEYAIGVSDNWTDIFDGGISGGVYGLAMTNDVIYALEYNSSSGNNTLWRHLSPASIPENSTEWSSSSITYDNYNGLPIRLNAKPQALKFTTSKLWAVSTNGTSNVLYSYTDVLVGTEVTLLKPIDDFLGQVNSLDTAPYDITFSWERPAVTTQYEFVMAQDEDFEIEVADFIVTTSDNIAYATVGQHQSSPRKVFYQPAVTYYWKVRAVSPSYTIYSETRHFLMGPLPPEGFEPVKLIPDEITSLINPSFAWWPMSGITEYQFVLSDNPEMTSPLINVYLDTTTFKTGITLEYGKHYFWRVRPSQPMVSGWSATLTFMLTGPITTIVDTVTQQGQTTYVPFYITFITTPGYVVGAITVGLILVGTIIVLLFSRRNVNISRGDSMKPQLKLDHYTDFLAVSIPAETFEQQPKATEFDKEGPDIVQDAKHFLWTVTQQEEVTALGQKRATEKDRDSHGKKLASKIHDLSKKVALYVKYPEDAATLLAIWAEYRSKKETSNYLVKSFDANPYNAIKFLKCYLPTAHLGEEVANIKDFDTVKYNLIAEVIDVTKMYETLSRLFKFKAEEIEDIVPVTPFDRDLATQFLRLHIKTKGVS